MFRGTKFIKFLATLAVLPKTILNNRMNSSFSFKSKLSWCYSSWADKLARQGIECILPPKTAVTTFAFSSVFILLLFCQALSKCWMFGGKAERKRRLEEELDFDPEDLALATVPGLQFNPKVLVYLYLYSPLALATVPGIQFNPKVLVCTST